MNIMKRIKNRYLKWKEARLIWVYCLSQSENTRGAKVVNSLLVLLVLSVIGFWHAPSFAQAGINLILILILWSFALYLINKKERRDIVINCRKKLATAEFTKRIDEASAENVLNALEKGIGSKFSVRFFEFQQDSLLGVYGSDKIALIYRYNFKDDLLETKDVMQILHDCRLKEVKKVRIFTNTDFSSKVTTLGQRFGIDLLLYNGTGLEKFLEGSVFYPTESELDNLIKRESIKMQNKITLIKKELLKKNKIRNYIIYSLVLAVLAKYEMGNVYLNMSFAIIMMGLAVLSLVINRKTNKEDIIF